MTSTAKKDITISLDEEEDPGIEHVSNEGEDTQNVDESTAAPSTLPTDETDEDNQLKRKSTRTPSVVWDHFTKVSDSKKNEKAKCNYCGSEYACGSNLLHHIRTQCKMFPGRGDKKQKTLCFNMMKGEGNSLVTHKFDPEEIREYVARMIVKDELPFSFVEN